MVTESLKVFPPPTNLGQVFSTGEQQILLVFLFSQFTVNLSDPLHV